MESVANTGPEISPGISKFDAENATSLTVDFLKRLGYRTIWRPMKVTLDGELYVVEMNSDGKTAKVQINTGSKEIREYEFGRDESLQKGSGLSKGKLGLIIVVLTVGIVVAKLLNVF
jgi:hypothetical protein